MGSFAVNARRALMAAVGAVALMLALCSSAFAAGSPYVIDDYGLLDSSTQSAMESQAKAMAKSYDVGPYLLIVDDIGSESAREFAKDRYKADKLGVGDDKSGILFMIAVDSRDYVTITHGDGVTAFTDYRIEAMEDDIVSYLKDDEWEDACRVYLDDCQETFEFNAAHGAPMDYDNDPASPSYDDGVIGLDDLALPAGIALVVALLVMFAVRAFLKGQLKSVAAGASARAFMAEPVEVTAANEVFLGATVSKTPIPKNDDGPGGGGGGSWVDSGGFGGSGGGKF